MTAMCCSTLSEHLHRGYGWRSVQIKPELRFKIMYMYMMDNLKHPSRLVYLGHFFWFHSSFNFEKNIHSVAVYCSRKCADFINHPCTLLERFCWKFPERTPGNLFLPKLLCEYNWMEQWRNFYLNKRDTFFLFLFRACVLTFQYWYVRSVAPGWGCRRVRAGYTACSSRACAGRWDSSWSGAISV